MLPVVARAADNVTILQSGQCGDSAFFKVTSDGVLTVYGSGIVNDYSVTPIGSRNLITSIVVEEGITRLGGWFFYCDGYSVWPVLESISLPSSLLSIGNGCFYSFPISVDLPNNLESIGNSAFAYASLTSLVIPDSVKVIGYSAFNSCPLTSVDIGSGLISMGYSVFSNCTSLLSVNVRAVAPPKAGTGLFNGCPDALRIYVPDISAYESAPGWSDYADWIVGGYTSGGGNTGGSGSGGTISGPDYTFHLEVEHTRLDDYYLDTDLQFWTVWSAYAGNDTQIDRSVIWTVDGLSNETYIDSDGLLHIGEHESRQYLNIRATSVSYPHLYAYAVIKLTHMTEEEANTPTTAPTEDNSEVLGAIDDLDQDVQQLQDSVDTLIEGDENSAVASDELGSASQDVSDAMDQVDDFQQSQMDVLDDNMQQIQDSVDFSGFVPALEFIMEQVNSIFDGIGDVSVVLTFPLYLGLFFYICSRAPGGTIPKISRYSKSIDSKAGGEKV